MGSDVCLSHFSHSLSSCFSVLCQQSSSYLCFADWLRGAIDSVVNQSCTRAVLFNVHLRCVLEQPRSERIFQYKTLNFLFAPQQLYVTIIENG